MHRTTPSRRIQCVPASVSALAIFAFAATSIASGQMPGQKMPGLVPIQVQQMAKGIRATADKEVLEATVCSDSVIHVIAVPVPLDHQPARPWILGEKEACPGAPFTFAQDDKSAVLRTAKIELALSLERGNLSFRTLTGETLLNEGSAIPRTYEPVELNGDRMNG